MKAQEKKSKTPAKAASKAASKVAVKSKAVLKTAAKTSAKTPVKTVSKAAKLPVKAKAVAKPVASKKPATRVVASPIKAASAKSKPAVKPKAVKPVAKTSTEKKGAAAKPTSKTVKTPHPQQSRSAAGATPASVAIKSVLSAKSAGGAPALKKPVQPVVAPAPLPTPRPPEKTMLIPAPPALKPGRRSSARALSQMPPPAPMVPTHAPDAAKASYSTMTERVIAPPPHVAAKKDPKLANNWKTTLAEALTDDEVKAMPDAEYMNEKQMAFFRHKLSILKQDIHNSAGETTEHLREDTVVVPDPADRATIEEEHALELRTRDRERKLLKKIEQSIARIDSGDYGYCDETGEPIGVGRLIARPTANLSLEAQQRRELKQKMFGD